MDLVSFIKMLFHTILNVNSNNIVYRTMKMVDSRSVEEFASLKLQYAYLNMS